MKEVKRFQFQFPLKRTLVIDCNEKTLHNGDLTITGEAYLNQDNEVSVDIDFISKGDRLNRVNIKDVLMSDGILCSLDFEGAAIAHVIKKHWPELLETPLYNHLNAA